MTLQAGIRVYLRAPDGSVDYPDATTATVGPGGALVVIRARPRGFPEALDEIPAERWWSWEPFASVAASRELPAGGTGSATEQ